MGSAAATAVLPGARCQVGGCAVPLHRASAYCSRYRICRRHMIAEEVLVAAVPSRWCQQVRIMTLWLARGRGRWRASELPCARAGFLCTRAESRFAYTLANIHFHEAV
jgi:SBP domain